MTARSSRKVKIKTVSVIIKFLLDVIDEVTPDVTQRGTESTSLTFIVNEKMRPLERLCVRGLCIFGTAEAIGDTSSF
jgi:hypothetical protein